MPIPAEQTSELVCVPGAIPAANREAHFALTKHLFAEAVEHREALPHGYVFHFPQDEFESVAKFVSGERQCCPFMRFEIVIDAEAMGMSLRITGPDGTRELMEAEFRLAECQGTACVCRASAS